MVSDERQHTGLEREAAEPEHLNAVLFDMDSQLQMAAESPTEYGKAALPELEKEQSDTYTDFKSEKE